MKEAVEEQTHACKDCLCERTGTTRRGFLQFTGGAIATGAIAASPLSAMAVQDEEGGGGIGEFFKSLLGICKTKE